MAKKKQVDIGTFAYLLERAFGTEIPRHWPVDRLTLGQVRKYLLARLKTVDPDRRRRFPIRRCDRRVRKILEWELAVEHGSVRPGSKLEEVIPANRRRTVWAAFERDLEMDMPPLTLSPWAKFVLGAMGGVSLIAVILSIVVPGLRGYIDYLVPIALGLVMFAFLLSRLRFMRGSMPHGIRTCRDLSRLVMHKHFSPLPHSETSEDDINEMLLAIIYRAYHVPAWRMNDESRIPPRIW